MKNETNVFRPHHTTQGVSRATAVKETKEGGGDDDFTNVNTT
jgi:hypothetical protein